MNNEEVFDFVTNEHFDNLNDPAVDSDVELFSD